VVDTRTATAARARAHAVDVTTATNEHDDAPKGLLGADSPRHEVLSDQGRLAEAGKLLRRARRVWRGTGYDWGVAYATAQLGRIAVREGRRDEGRRELQDALATFRRLRVAGDAWWVEALLLEAAAYSGRAVETLEEADRLLLKCGRSVHGGRIVSLLLRVRGFALAQLGREEEADEALEASLAEGRLQDDLYDVAVALDAIDKLSGRITASLPERRHERDGLLKRLQVVSLPTPPLAAPRISVDDAPRESLWRCFGSTHDEQVRRARPLLPDETSRLLPLDRGALARKSPICCSPLSGPSMCGSVETRLHRRGQQSRPGACSARLAGHAAQTRREVQPPSTTLPPRSTERA
jgi:hypothetical protein